MSWNEFWKTLKRNWRAAVYLLVLAALAVLLVVVCVRRGQTAAQPEPTPRTSAAVQKDAAQTLLDGMTTREKICQLLIVHPEVLTGGGTVTAMTDDLAAALRDYPVGGFLLSAGNMTSGEQLAALTSALSAADATAPLVTVDEEGGRVARLMNTVGTTKLNSMYSYRSLGTQGAYDNAQTLAHDIAAYGFNTDFAPVADVWTNKRSNAIGDRAYSDDYDEAATLVAAAVSGFRDAGVICCLKHFPGHGSTATDSHNGAATVDKTLPQLRQEDLKPFVSGIAAGADMVMVGHLTVPTMDDVPASLSHKLVTNLLRYDLGFRGVIVTDGLQMQALAQYTDGEKAVLALAAGNDMLLEIGDVPGAVAAVEQALADGTLTQAALDASVLRVLQLKLAHGIVPLPDNRLPVLAKLVHTEKIVPATVTFVDIAGIVKGASEGEGLGNKFLANIREADAICEVVRAFEDDDIVHVNGKVDPSDDIETINTELILADLQTIENALPKLEKDLRGKKIEPAYMEAVKQAKTILEAGETIDKAAREGRFDKDSVYDLHLMSAKPFIYVFNVDDAELQNKDMQAKLAASVAPAPAIFLNAQFEADLTELDEADAREMLADAGLEESGLDQLARVGYDTLGLSTFLTAGEKEVRAWQIHKGYTAPQAAGVIHTDFEKGFIKADIVSYDDFVAAEGSMVKIKEEGKLRQEGRDYVMQDGDIVEFKFNVSK